MSHPGASLGTMSDDHFRPSPRLKDALVADLVEDKDEDLPELVGETTTDEHTWTSTWLASLGSLHRRTEFTVSIVCCWMSSNNSLRSSTPGRFPTTDASAIRLPKPPRVGLRLTRCTPSSGQVRETGGRTAPC